MAVTNAVLEWSGGRVSFVSDPDPEAWARFIVTDIAGWYGGVGVRSESMDRLGHGTIAGRSWRRGRALTLRGHVEVASPSDRDYVMRDLSGVLWDGLEGTLTATIDGLTLSCPVRLDGEPGIVPDGASSVTVQLPLASPDPWLFGPWRTSALRPVGAGVGFDFPPFGDSGVITFGSAVDSGAIAWNDGNADSTPRFEVYADAPGGFYISLGDRVIEYPRPTWAHSPVTVDMGGEVLLSGYDQSHYLSVREWGAIGPRSLETVRFELLQGGHGWCNVLHRDTYI